MMVRVITCAALLGVCFLAGCGFNNTGLGARIEHFRGDHAYAVRTRMFGVHASTESIDGGVSIGWLDRTIWFKRHDDANGSPLELSPEATLTPLKHNEEVPRSALGEAIAISTRRVGLQLAANRQSAGVSLGFRMTQALMLDASKDQIVFVNINGTNPERSQISIWENPP